MKNKLNKLAISSLLAIMLVGGLASAQTATDTKVSTEASSAPIVSPFNKSYRDGNMMDNGNWNNKNGNRMFNNEEGWRSMMPAFVAGMIGVSIFFSIIGLLLLAFWIWMLVHATTHDIKHKPLWLLVIWFMHIIGAVIYFFAVKKRYEAEMQEDCGCDSCTCTDEESAAFCESEEIKCACGKGEVCVCNK
ncbi:MAG: PLDc_N domain-containing protein [Candidatus Pacebacteria bacterium]|nr:PLDc_N domain-containing protein [Candidatus Paceibacterota bacterium]